jgi:hypothetical protein
LSDDLGLPSLFADAEASVVDPLASLFSSSSFFLFSWFALASSSDNGSVACSTAESKKFLPLSFSLQKPGVVEKVARASDGWLGGIRLLEMQGYRSEALVVHLEADRVGIVV